MSHQSALKYTLTDLPEQIPIFPLDGALLLPGGELPLNIFEDRYLAMVRAALGTPLRLIGMIQPQNHDRHPDTLFHVGCAGRISSFHETDDHRYLITLSGLCRFRIITELPQMDGYRQIQANFAPFIDDLTPNTDLSLDRTRLLGLLKEYFQTEGLSCNWEQVKNASDDTLMTALSMICPFDSAEKQALLEAQTPQNRSSIFMTLLELAIRQEKQGHKTPNGQCH